MAAERKAAALKAVEDRRYQLNYTNPESRAKVSELLEAFDPEGDGQWSSVDLADPSTRSAHLAEALSLSELTSDTPQRASFTARSALERHSH